eukprot:366441-Chlamydomonas_euryale.AAC.25
MPLCSGRRDGCGFVQHARAAALGGGGWARQHPRARRRPTQGRPRHKQDHDAAAALSAACGAPAAAPDEAVGAAAAAVGARR